MAFDLNKFAQSAEQYAPPPPPEEKSIWDTVSGLADGVADFAGNAFNWAESTISDTVQAAEDFLLAKNYEELQKGKEEMNYLPFRETAREFTAAYADNPDSILQPIAQTIRASETAYNYWQTDEDKLKRAREISAETNLPAETILYDAEAWKSANLVYDDIQSAKQLNVDNGNSWSLEDVYAKYPEIRGIADKDAVSGALILKDVANVGKELDIIDTFTKYLSTGNSQLELNNLRFKAGMGTADENDLQRMQELEKKVEEDSRKNQIRFLDNPLAYAVSGVASSAPEMWQSIYTGLEDAGAWWAAGTWAGAAAGSALPGPGTAAGAAAGGVIGGAIGAVKGAAKVLVTKEARNAAIREYLLQRAAKNTAPNLMKLGAQAGAFSGMATPEAGERYAEYSELKDKDGNPLMSKEEAWHRALLGGSANAALEVMPTFGVLGNMLKGAPHASKVISEIVTANTANMGTKAMTGTFAKKYGKNVLKIAGVEAGEEGIQAIADDLLTNDIKNTYGRAYTGKDGKLYYTGDALSAYDIVTDGLKASLQALPSSFIFGAAGGFTPVAGMAGRYAARARHLSALEKAHGEMARQTYTGTVMAEQLQQAVHDSRLKDTAPDVQRKLIKEKAAGTGFETVYIDTELALEKENGQNDLEAVAKTIGLSQEDLQTAIDTKGTIAVPLECFAQSEASSEVLEAASFNPEAEPMARMQKNAQDVIRRMQELVEKAADHQIKMVDIISRELFPEETQQATVNRELVQAAIIENPENPALGLKTLIEKYKAQKMAILEPALKFLDDTSGNGTVIVPIDDEGHTVRLSENAKWYQDFWKEFGRKPTKAELIEIAEGMVTGKSNIEYWTITSEEEEQQAKDIMLDIAELNHKLQLLENIKPKMQGINGVEMRLTEGFSAEAYKVYRILNEQLKNAPGTASRAGRISAILFARHADIFAKAMRENGAADYTALDYLKQHQVVFNQDLSGGMNQDTGNEIIKYPDNAAEASVKLFSQEAIPVEANIVVSEDKRVTEAAVNAFSEKYPSGIEVNTPIGKVTISRRGIRNSLNHKCYQAKMDSVLSLGEGVKNMTYIGSARDFDGKPITNHFFAYPIEYNNERRYVLCRIKHADSGRPSFYVHDVIPENDIQKMSQSVKYAAHVDESTRDLRGSALYSYILTEFYRKGKEKNQNIFNQMAGERAAANLDIGQAGLLAKLREAQSMNDTVEEIYRQTGWILGADGKWRFEIPDNLDAVDYGVLHENGEAKLSEVYDNPKLYMAYPQLQDIPVVMENGMENSAGSTNGLRIRIAPKAGKTTLLHEIQHIIQGYENFASGGSPDSVINRIEDRVYSLKKTIEGGFKSNTGDVFRLLEDYDNAKHGMVRAMRSRKRSEAAQFKGLMQELKGKIADNSRNPEDVDNVISTYYELKKLNDILTEYRNTPSNERPAMREKLYRQLAGEQEAVFTEKRALSANTEDMPVPHGYDAVVVFDGKSQALSIKNDTGGGFGAYNQENSGKTLTAYHNITAHELEKALNFGGFPVPSLAVVKSDVPYEKYGEISLVGTKDLVNPEKGVPVYSKDGYTVTFPPVEHKAPSKAAVSRFTKKWAAKFEEMGKGTIISSLQTAYKYIDQYLDEITNSIVFQYHYLTEILGKNIDIPRRQIDYTSALMKQENIRKQVLEALNLKDKAAQKDELEKIIKGFFDRKIERSSAPDAKPLIRRRVPGLIKERDKYLELLQTDPESVVKKIKAEHKRVEDSKTNGEYDYTELRYKIRKEYADELNSAEYSKWAADELRDLSGPDLVRIGKKLEPFNLQNVVKSMLTKAGAAKEATLTYSAGMVAAKSAKIFKNISEMHKNESMLGTVEQFDADAEKTQKLGEEYREAVYNDSGSQYFFELANGCMEALAKAADKTGHTTKAKLRTQLRKLGIENVTDETLQKGVEYLTAITESTTQYFEAKPQRAVDISEFAGAVVPETASTDLINRLREAGLQVETYNTEIEGDRQRAVEKIQALPDVLFQGIRGQSAPLSTGGYIMSLLQTADESTFLHESGHLFLWDLEQLAGFGGQYAEDWRVVQEWASYETGAEKLYKGTPFEKEFATLAQNIRAAEDAGDVNTVDSLKRRWMHERFARGFEMYLKQGKAPSKGLQSVFRKFKQFLKTIYIAFTGEGVRANSTVERVMARMIASEDEIEAAELDDRFKDISKAGGEKLMGESTQETYQRWWDEAKEEAKERLMKILMQDLEEEKIRKFSEVMTNERSRMRKELEQLPLYLAQKIISETGNKNAAVELGFYDSVEAYEAELNEMPSLSQALDDYMTEFARAKDKEIMQAKVSEEKIAELIQQTHYHKKLMALETEIMKSKEEAVNKINAKAKAAMDELDESIKALNDDIDIQLERKTDKSIKKVIDAINKLRFSTRWTPAELARIDDIIHSATKQEMSQVLKEFTKQAGEWKKNLKAVQEAFNGRMKMMKKMAEQDLAGRSIAEACSYNTYVTREKKAAKLVDKMFRAGKWDVAMVQQEARFTSAALADAAKKNQEHVNKLLNTIEKQLKARTVKLPKEEKYWHRQLAYLLHLIPEAPERPEECPDLKDIFTGLNESLDIDFNIGSIYDIITQESFTGYRSLTIAQLEEVVNAMTVLYKTGRDKFKMKSFDGMLISDVVDEILEDIHNNTGKLPSVETKAVMDDKGGIGYSDLLAKIPGFGESLSQLGQQYELSMLRPETLLKILGKSAHKYIMGLYDRAAVDEGRRMAEAIAELSKIMSVYSQKEKKEMKKKKYKLETGYGMEEFSKENVLCMALNYGNEINWLRLCKGLGVEDGNYLRSFLDENMTKKDWLTVQALWDHIGKYWKDTVKVEQELNGVTLKGVEARGFWATVNGELLKLRGGYYPIVYNPEKSTKAAEQTVDEAAKRTMSGAQVLGTGRGFTNARSEAKNIARPLALQLDVVSSHVDQVIHNISFRIACRDVYRLTHDSRFQEAVISTLGRKALDSIQKWAVDCWRVLPNNSGTAEGFFNKVLAGLRSNAGFAIMGFRMWPAIENITNILPMMDQVGAKNALMAISDFYTDFRKNRELINLSPFMRERADSIDRDIRSVKAPFEGSGPVSGWLKQYAYFPLVLTDRMLSEPLWCRVYKASIEKNFIAVHEENQRQLARFRMAQEKAQELRGQMADLVSERAKLRNSLQEDEANDVPYTPDALSHITAAKIRIAEIEKALEPMNKELWAAERDIDLLENIEVKSQNDILEEAKELSVRDADAAVRNAFGSGKTKDLAPALREKSELMKMFTVFISYFNAQMNAIALSYYGGKFAREDLTGLQNLGRWMPLIRSLMYRIFLTALIGSLLKMALTGDGSDDKHKYRKVKDAEGNERTEEIPLLERFLVQFGKNFVSTATGSLIGIREIVGVLNNLAFEGTDYGRGAGGAPIAITCANKALKALKLAMAKADKDAEIEEAEKKKKEKYAKMTPAARKKFDDEQKYKKPPQRINYIDIAKEVVGAVTSATAARTGVTDTIANTAFTTLQYMLDGDGRYDSTLSNIVWSAFWNKKPVEREVPKKPEEPKKKKKGAKK